MLSAAVLGGIFASPSVSSVLAAIRAASASNNNAGVLLIVKNYTGDRLNFGMACERANQDGINCRMVVVAVRMIYKFFDCHEYESHTSLE